MGDHDETALVTAEEVPQPRDRVRVEVVRRLVEEQGRRRPARPARRGEEDLRELHAAALTAGEGLELLVEDPLREPEAVADAGGLGVRLVAAEGRVALLEPAVLADRRVPLGVGAGLHDLLLALHALAELVQPPGREHPVPGRLVDVPLLGVLREVADLAGAGHRPAVGLPLPGEDPHRRRLARAVAADETDAVARLDPEQLARGVEQGTGADAHFKILGDNHNGPA